MEMMDEYTGYVTTYDEAIEKRGKIDTDKNVCSGLCV